MLHLKENLTFDQAGLTLENSGKDGKDLYMKGICIQGGVKNANERIYPVTEIAKATKTLKDQKICLEVMYFVFMKNLKILKILIDHDHIAQTNFDLLTQKLNK